MHRFWSTVIEPVLMILQPKNIVEIGSDYGKNTSYLLQFCEQNSATLHCIDPLPKYDVAEWQKKYGSIFDMHLSLSLNALPKIEKFDLILIDGDHNWYTVFNELKLIEKCCMTKSQPFPLVMVHDIWWPYGRRDLYYNPDNIPDAFRKPYRKRGMRPDSTELLEKGGLNPHLCNSIYENDLQNGVLTAIEDFSKETKHQLELIEIPGFHGFGILILKQLMVQNKKLARLISEFKFRPITKQYISAIEEARVKFEIQFKEKTTAYIVFKANQKEEFEKLQSELEERKAGIETKVREIKGIQDQLQESLAEVTGLQSETKERDTVLKAKEKQIDSIQNQLQESLAEVTGLQGEIKERDTVLKAKEKQIDSIQNQLQESLAEVTGLQSEIKERDTVLKAKEKQIDSIQNQLQESLAEVTGLQSEIKERDTLLEAKEKQIDSQQNQLLESLNELKFKETELVNFQHKLVPANQNLSEKDRQFSEYNSILKGRTRDVEKLISWVDQLNLCISAILGSRRWRSGNMIGELSRRVKFRPRVPMATDQITDILKQFEQWKKSNKLKKAQISKIQSYDITRSADTTQLPHQPNKMIGKYGTKLFYQVLESVLNDNPDKKLLQDFEQSENFIRETSLRFLDNSEPSLVSIIMPTFNRANIISNSIQSVLDQKYKNWELWVCDDGSMDNTEEIVRSFNDARINYVKFAHVGAARARNIGLSHAKGLFMAYLDSDNIWHPQYLNMMVQSLNKNNGMYSAYAKYIDIIINSGTYKIKKFSNLPFNYESLLQKNFIDLSAFVHKRELYENLGGFDERLCRRQDYDLILKYAYLLEPIYINAFLLIYQRNESWKQITQINQQDNSCVDIMDTSLESYFLKGLPLTKKPAYKSVTVLSWDICRNHFSKAYNMAECLSRDYNAQLIGFRFFNAKIFPPYKNESPSFDTLYLEGSQFPEFQKPFSRALTNIKGDVIYAVKPRLPSLGLALLANYHFGMPVVLEVNDLESVVSNPNKSVIDQDFNLDSIDISNKQLLNPYSDLWSKIMEKFAFEVPVIVTHNRNIDSYFGHRCFYIRNHKDETFYDPGKYNRDEIRQELGISRDDRVILFAGLLREHKGIFELVKLIKRLDDERYKLIFVGSRVTPDQERLKSEFGDFIRILPPQNRNEMAMINLAADVVIIWLNPSIEASHYQMPYKLTDAFAMETPVIANPISDMRDLGKKGYLRLVEYGDFDNVCTEIEKIFTEPNQTMDMVKRSRRLYHRQFSYLAAKTNFHLICDISVKLQNKTHKVSEKFAGFFARFLETNADTIQNSNDTKK